MPNLIDLNRGKQPFVIRNKSETKAEIIIYAAIGSMWFEDSISAKQFSDEIGKLPKTVNDITVRINSPGGDVFDGITIYNRLVQHPAKITVYIDGLAASIASIIALAGDEVIIGEGAMFMIHLPWTGRYGDRIEFEKVINHLLDIEEQMISIYAKKTKMSRLEIKQMIEDETWMDADTAIKHGFVDKKSAEEALPVAASIMDRANWIRRQPKMKTESVEIRTKISSFKDEIEKFCTR